MWWVWIVVGAGVLQLVLLACFGVRLWRKAVGLAEALVEVADQVGAGLDLAAGAEATPRRSAPAAGQPA
ncbi:MAG: hypothetical protein ACK5LS_01690 [Propioniciclava sp.]